MSECTRTCGKASSYNDGCRLPPCREAERLTKQKSVAKLRAKPFDQIPHGTSNAYTNYACRCPPCKEAGRIRNKRQRENRKARLRASFDRIPHGIRGYKNYGCKCGVCKAAGVQYRAGLKARSSTESS